MGQIGEFANYGERIFSCPHCGITDCGAEEVYCHNCGKLLHNVCINDECEAAGLIIDTDMKYCPLCGGSTSFMNHGYFD